MSKKYVAAVTMWYESMIYTVMDSMHETLADGRQVAKKLLGMVAG